MEEDRGRSAERLITFVDAVVAIAVTLLALPLADIPGEVASRGGGLDRILEEGALPLGAFALSFFVIARLWWGHHRIFAHVVRWDAVVVWTTIVWLFTIVLLAPATALTRQLDPDPGPPDPYANAGAVAIYIGVMAASSWLLTALARHVQRTPSLTDGHDTEAGDRLFNSVETSISFTIALVVGTAVPAINYFALLSLVVTGQIGRLLRRRRHRRAR
ncbi:TMEM175 family protein [Amnibacterium kyonggiense]|uniref:Putative membrane protein n=1 Tax=Amnibacterium kyonggiense TaxID=595671 RepID=A0A4R7FRK6_9MICO|nr:TMEM175 family protein [Amnibacterium kyonggiense]TDS80451.1 putative membrane protein [Amnibacterium kyonggiense]